jgi:hypothetical protein
MPPDLFQNGPEQLFWNLPWVGNGVNVSGGPAWR